MFILALLPFLTRPSVRSRPRPRWRSGPSPCGWSSIWPGAEGAVAAGSVQADPGDGAVVHSLEAAQAVRQPVDAGGITPHGDDLHAVMVVEVDVQVGDDHVHGIVLEVE